jgi:hypothetical protein
MIFREDGDELLKFLKMKYKDGSVRNSHAEFRDEDGIILWECANVLYTGIQTELWKDLEMSNMILWVYRKGIA